MTKESYQCMACGVEFNRDHPGPVTCHSCDSIYVKWVNFEADWEMIDDKWQRKSLTKTINSV